MSPHSTPHAPPQRHVYGVAELTRKVKRLLEENFPFLWISGEISNLRVPTSGHCYFTLKDDAAQISAVMFRGQAKALKFRIRDGQAVIGLGRISVYEPRGAYQVIFEYLEPKGIGGLQLAFEKLKRRLFDEGLFDEEHKQPLPTLPQRVAVVTSPSGAAVRDFIKVAQRRFPNLSILVVPVRVQGERAPGEIMRAMAVLNRLETADLIVLARGGGSIEDLWAFNDEGVARAIFDSRLPVVSAVGHETDFTIADFVADLRAPTPSAAAELAIPAKQERLQTISDFKRKLYGLISNILYINDLKLSGISRRMVHPKKRLQEMRIRLDDASMGLESAMAGILIRRKERTAYAHKALTGFSPARSIGALQDRNASARRLLITHIKRMMRDRKAACRAQAAMLDALNPMSILRRGYSITRTPDKGRIVRSANQVKAGQALEVLLGKGKLTVTVDERDPTFESIRSRN